MKYIFGKARHIEIFEQQYWIPQNEMFVIGNMSDFYDLIKTSEGRIMVRNMREFENEIIAESLEQLQIIIDEIIEPWIGNEHEFILPRTSENLNWYKQYISRNKNKENYHLSFWVNFAFREFDIRWDV